MSKMAIQPEHLAIVKGILQREVPQYPVWVFGSRVKNTVKPYSDLLWKVDIIDWAATSGQFREILCEKYVVL